MQHHKRTKRKIIGLLAGVTLLGACSRQPPLAEDLSDYQQRLANVLDASAPQALPAPTLALPSVRDMRAQTAQLSIKLNEFYALQECPVATLIAERNTALGRTQLPSTRYVHEVRLIAGLQDCLARTQDEKMRTQLLSWLSAKQADLSANWVNLMLTSEETQKAFGTNQGLIAGDESDNLSSVSQALSGLVSLAQTPSDDIAQVEAQLKQLADSPLPARLWRSQRLLGDTLAQTTQWLNTHTETISCKNNATKQRAEYLNNVFRLYFIGKIQPLAASLNQYHYAIEESFQTLLNHAEVTPVFKDHLQRQLAHYTRYQQQLREHVMFWQRFLRRCGMSPAV